MDVILAVTLDTGRRRFAKCHRRLVTSAAGHRNMRAVERKVAQIVREAGWIQLVDVGVAPQVLGMAAAALAGLRLWHAPVIAGLAPNVGGDLLVTVQAQRGLPITVRTIVAAAAVLLELCMRAAHRPRHDEFLETGRLRKRD